ncbi:MAG TPA: 1,2-phenylacetyl-CoA epoxidase subunit PaaD, partial [Gemmatimonadaceae bacterium]|nr:1,2-phenylacetyl-CoA epoxidase subunit PaaD [Gemmatimonadaceae bacterium]
MAKVPATREAVLEILAEVKDPELPMIDVVELGIVRDVSFDDGHLTVDITPTYSGCPAMQVIEQEIVATLASHGFADASVRMVYSPAWTTDWMTEAAREKLREHGIAPPHLVEVSGGGIAELVSLRRAKPTTTCPFCGSSNTTEKSEFGSTACKSIHFCNSCHQPFD